MHMSDTGQILYFINFHYGLKKKYLISFDVYANVICHKGKNNEQPFPNSGDAEELWKERDFSGSR